MDLVFCSHEKRAKLFLTDFLYHKKLNPFYGQRDFFFGKQYVAYGNTIGPNNTLIDFLIQLLKERKSSNLISIRRLLFMKDNSKTDLIDSFTTKEAYMSYINGFKKIEEIVNDSEVIHDIKLALELLLSICSYPCFYAFLNVIIVPKNFQNAAFLTFPPLHIAPFEYISSFSFCIYYDLNSGYYKVAWIADNNTKKRLCIGEQFIGMVELITGMDYMNNFQINTYEALQLKKCPPFRHFLTVGDECNLFLSRVFSIDVMKEMKERKEKERKCRRWQAERIKRKQTDTKKEYITRVTMYYKTNEE